MKKYALGLVIASLMSLQSLAAPTPFFTAIVNGAPFNDLLLSTAAELEAIKNTAGFGCPGCYGFEVDVIYPDESQETWFFRTALSPTGEIWVTLEP